MPTKESIREQYRDGCIMAEEAWNALVYYGFCQTIEEAQAYIVSEEN